MNKNCVIIQGPITREQVDRHKQIWKDDQIIFSTWETVSTDWFNADDVVLYNKIPNNTGISNLNLQKITTQAGCIKAKEMGYDFVIKWRNDMFPTTKNILLHLFDKSAFNIYSWISANGYNYISDFFYAGNPIDIYELFEGPTNGVNAEIVLSKTFFDKKFDDKKINFIRNKLVTGINDIIWESRHQFGTIALSEYRPGTGKCNDYIIKNIQQ
jgi:hypothetical protein